MVAPANVDHGLLPGTLRLRRDLEQRPPVTLLILSVGPASEVKGRGRMRILADFLRSIIAQSTYPDYTVLIIDDGEVSPRTAELLKACGGNYLSCAREAGAALSFSRKVNLTVGCVEEGRGSCVRAETGLCAFAVRAFRVSRATQPIVTAARSRSDTSIDCAVPTGVIESYSASAGSGPVVVTTSTSQQSTGYYFSVPFGYLGAKWASPAVTYLLNASDIDIVRRETLVDAGTAEWNGAGSAFRFTDGGPTSAGFAHDGLNVISWANGLPDGVLAWASSWVSGGIVSECDVQFSNACSSGDGAPGTDTYDIQEIAAHETGHWLRLADQYTPGDSAKVMYGIGGPNQQNKRVLAAGDSAGIDWICPRVGPSLSAIPTRAASSPMSMAVDCTD